LSLCYCQHIEEDGLDLIGSIDNLVSIDLSGCQCGDHVCHILFLSENSDLFINDFFYKNERA
jgi:hypothetical protein